MTPSGDIISSSPGNLINFISRQYNIRKLVVRGQSAEGGVKEDPEQHLRNTGTSEANMLYITHPAHSVGLHVFFPRNLSVLSGGTIIL